MRRSRVISVLVVLFSLVIAAGVWARGSQETQLTDDSAKITSTSSTSSGEAAVTQTLETMFGVSADQITALRNDNLGYGDIAVLLALAQTMPGGVTQGNIDTVLQDRQGPPVVGWGKIAQNMGVNLGTVVSSVAKTLNQSAQGLAKAQGASGNGNGSGNSAGASSGAGAGAGNAGSNPGSGKRP